jgi:hypothetical protein
MLARLIKGSCPSGRSSGNVFPWLDNLQPRFQDQFVHYLAEVVRWYRDTHNIIFRCPSVPTDHLCSRADL